MWSREEGYSSYSLAEVTPLEEFPKTERTKMDPYDRRYQKYWFALKSIFSTVNVDIVIRNVFVNASRVVDPLRKKSTGDGLFAKRNIPVGTLVKNTKKFKDFPLRTYFLKPFCRL